MNNPCLLTIFTSGYIQQISSSYSFINVETKASLFDMKKDRISSWIEGQEFLDAFES